MRFLYVLGLILGYFFLMIIFMIVALVIAKRKLAWVSYAMAAIIQLMALLGNQKSGMDVTMYWFIYVIILIITAVIIILRQRKISNVNTSVEINNSENNEEETQG